MAWPGSAWLLLSFSPFPVRHPVQSPCVNGYGLTAPVKGTLHFQVGLLISFAHSHLQRHSAAQSHQSPSLPVPGSLLARGSWEKGLTNRPDPGTTHNFWMNTLDSITPKNVNWVVNYHSELSVSFNSSFKKITLFPNPLGHDFGLTPKKSQKSQDKSAFYKANVSLFCFFVEVKSLFCIGQGQIAKYCKVFGL